MPVRQQALEGLSAFALVSACCRWPPTPARDEDVRVAASRVTDWDIFGRVVERHRVAGLVHRALRRANVAVPEPAARILRGSSIIIGRKSLALATESVRLQKAFDTVGLSVLFLKGASLEKIAYGTHGIKHAWDIDILVAPHSMLAVLACLVSCGYRRVQPSEDFDIAQFESWMVVNKECVFFNSERQSFLELHWRLSDNPLLMFGIGVASPSQEVRLSGTAYLRTLAEIELFGYLCVHGATHGWSRLKWIADVGAFLSLKSAEEIEGLYRASQLQGTGRCSAQALLLCKRLFGTTLTDALSAELRGDPKACRLETVALDAMSGAGDREILDRRLGDLRIRASKFLFEDGWRHFWGELRSQLVGANDMLFIPLPRWLHFLYPAIRLPSWLWRVALRGGRGALKAPIRLD